MTSTDFSNLADLIQGDSIPRWFRQQVNQKSAEILHTLEQGRSITLRGPQGQAITIGPVSHGEPQTA